MVKLEHFVGSGKILARAVGPAAALHILSEYGGQSFWIAKEPKAEHATSRKLGLKAHQALAKFWAEREFELPMASHVRKNMRNEDILEDAKSMSMREMVSKYKMSRCQIQVILKKNQQPNDEPNSAEEKQLKMF